MNVEYEAEDQRLDAPRPMHFALAMFISFLLFNSGYIISQTFRWTDHLQGFFNGLIHTMFFAVGWVMYFIPWGLIVYFCFRNRIDKRRRTIWLLAPSLLITLFMVGGLMLDPPSPRKRFKAFTSVELPKNPSDLETYFSGGGIADYGDTYYFKASSLEIERIIREMKMTEDKSFSRSGYSHTFIKALPSSPDFRDWENAKQYKWSDSRNHWFSYLITDSAKSQAYIFVGCT